MAIREDVLDCLRERLLNRSESGPVFERDEDYMTWLIGSKDGGNGGLLNDPGSALSRPILRGADDGTHPGVALLPEEEIQLRKVMRRATPGGLSTGLTVKSVAMLLGSTTFIGPLLAEGSY